MGYGSAGGLNLSPSHTDRLGLYAECSGWKCANVAGRAHHPYIWKPMWFLSFLWNKGEMELAFISACDWCARLGNKYLVPSITIDFP